MFQEKTRTNLWQKSNKTARCVLVLILSLFLAYGTYLRPANSVSLDDVDTESQNAPLDDRDLIDTSKASFIHKYLPPGSYLTPQEVKAGMTGYGLSVFQGSTIEKFNITVIGVLKRVLSGRDAILVRLSGPAMEKNNVIRGMSGSPCYINGKLIGAISFGYDFSKEPIAGITPIVDMLDSLAENHEGKTPVAKGIQNRSFNVPADQSGLHNVSSGELRMMPLVSPVALSGFSPAAEKFLGDKFHELGMMVSSGSSGGMTSSGLNPSAYGQIKPGSSIAVLLTSGDFTSVATGTATARFGNKVVAFGHPFLSAGSIEFPMATAIVHKVLPSLSTSFKLSSPIAEVGSFTADRPWSCGGQIGKPAKMIPCSFDIVDETRKIERVYNSKIIDHPDMTAQLLAATTMSAVDATHQYAGPYVAKVESRLEADGIEPLVRTDRFASNIAAHSVLEMLMGFMSGNSIAGATFKNASSITNNEFQKASLKSFKIRVTLEDGHHTATIDRVYVEKPFAAPGEPVKVMCIVKPYNQEPKIETLSFQIPRDAPDGNLVIGVAGGDQIDYVRRRMGLSDPEPESLKQIVDELRRQGRGDAINLVVGLPEQTLLMDGIKIPDPPSQWSKVLFSNRHTRGPQIIKGELQTNKQTNWLLYGSHILTVEVRNPDKAAAKSPPSTMPTYLGGDDPAMTELARKTLGSSPGKPGGAPGRQSPGVTVIQGGIAASAVLVESGTVQPAASTTTKTTTATGSIFSSAGKLYPHMRLHQIWREETEEDFHNGKTEGTTIDSWGRIGPGLDQVASKSIAPDSTIWSGIWSQGSFYFSTDNKIWKWKGDESKPEKVATLDTSIIPALTADSTGTLYAAAVPGGGVYAIAPGAAPKQIFKPSEPVVTTLCCDGNDNIYAGVAGNGKVYKIDKNHTAGLLFDTGQAHVSALFYSRAHKQLYIGTAEKGSVYRIDENGKTRAIYQTPDHIVTGIAKTRGGDVYVATSNQGKLVRVLNSGDAQALASSEAFYTLYYDAERDAVFSGDAEGDVTMAAVDKVTEQAYFIPVCHTDQEAVLSLSSNGKQLFVGSSNLAELKCFNLSAARTPYYESKVKDAERISNWIRLRTSGPFTESDHGVALHVKVETRTGNTSMADLTWSPWSAATFDGESYLLSSPAGRFLQYKLTWTSTTDSANLKQEGPQIGRVDVVYMPRDIAPQFSSISLKAAGAVSGKQDITVAATDADGDNMLCSIDISSDGGSTWQKLSSDLRPKNAKKESSSRESDKKDAGKKDAGKTDAGKKDADKTDSDKTDSDKTDSGKTDSGKTDSAKTDLGKTDSDKTDSAKTDAAKTDAAKTDSAKTDSGKTDSGKNGLDKSDADKQESDKKHSDKNDSEQKKPDGKDPGNKKTDKGSPENNGSGNKGLEKKEPGKKEPDKRNSEKIGSEKKDADKKAAERKDPDSKNSGRNDSSGKGSPDKSETLDSDKSPLTRIRKAVPLDNDDKSDTDESKDNVKDTPESDKDKDKDKDKKDEDAAPDRDDKKDADKSEDKKKPGKAKSARGATAAPPAGSSGKASEGTSSETFLYHWDTTKQKDGNYILKFTVDDRLSNPEDHHRVINVRAVTVDNTPPEIEFIECRRKGNNKVEFKVVAKDKQCPIVNAMFRFDDGDFFAFAATSNTSDGLSNTLIATDVPCAASAKKIEIKVSDRAGNIATKSANIK